MSLLQRFANYFDTRTLRQGRVLFFRGKVKVNSGTSANLHAVVNDQGEHQVSFRLKNRDLLTYCSCPGFVEDGDDCHHLVATLAAADHHGYLSDVGRRTELMPDDELLEQHEIQDIKDLIPAGALKTILKRFPGMLKAAYLPVRKQTKSAPKPPSWEDKLGRILTSASVSGERPPLLPGWELIYIVDLGLSLRSRSFVIELAARGPKKSGGWTKPKTMAMRSTAHIDALPDPDDLRIVSALVGAPDHYYGDVYRPSSKYTIGVGLQSVLVPEMARTGRLYLRADDRADIEGPIEFDDGLPWELVLDVSRDVKGKSYRLGRRIRRGSEELKDGQAFVIGSGWLIAERKIARLAHGEAELMVKELELADIRIPEKKGAVFVERLLESPVLPKLDLPEELRVDEVAAEPKPSLKISKPKRSWGTERLQAELAFDYEKTVVRADDPRIMVLLGERRATRRDLAAEDRAAARLTGLALKLVASPYGRERSGTFEFPPKRLPEVVRKLTAEHWRVEAEGKLYRSPSAFRVEVKSGIDWFDLDARTDFGGVSASLPALLAALKKGEGTVVLDDGTIGMLPEEWLGKWRFVAELGEAEGDTVRFRSSQAGFLDALLAAAPEASCDEVFRRAREELTKFERITPENAPAGFEGKLRGYQREGLGWLGFLERFGFGGVLADDMGLGKTVQALAALERWRELRGGLAPKDPARPHPSIVVAPRSLVFNWKDEAARFAPKLRVLDYTGASREGRAAETETYDLLLTTYGTLRRDAATLKDIEFDYAILDEAQAIKNASTGSAKAARLLRAKHRRALSGTPIENHLGELWSLFEFLNPGMLGKSSTFAALASGKGKGKPRQAGDGNGEDGRRVLARALRPFILRRTKQQVAKDLPSKTEQTVYCELEGPQRKLYDELRDHYRASLLGKIERDGLGKSKIQVLEALLRLRQAACHPGLIDKKRTAEPCAKLDALLPQLAEIVDEGSKALVFSQFTSLLAILRQRLDDDGIAYEYLDGRTRDRAARVERFQTDPKRKLFLISLKAGGLGLNLTAAEYVFLLDPWWNPAVEAQAVDRAHRIGQTKACFAYRLIAKDTVEEKVLELQRHKRELADAIVSADGGLIRDMTREDLELLLA